MLRNPWTKRCALIAVCGALTAATALVLPHARAAADGDDQPLSPALKALQGTWIAEENGSIQTIWTITKDSLTARVKGVEYVGKLTADDQAQPHPSLTAEIEKGPEDMKGKTVKGIYKLEGGKLTANFAGPDEDPPTDFTPVADKYHLFELTKVKR